MANLSAVRHSPELASGSPVRLLPPLSRFVLRGGPQVMAAAGTCLGLSISAVACRSAQQGERAALWMGPDEQLLLTSVADGAAVRGELGRSLESLPHSLVDVSHRQVAFELAGAQARNILSAGCPLDLHIGSFPVGMCTRTVLAKCDIVLWRTGDERFHVEVWRSFAGYASRFLAEAGETL